MARRFRALLSEHLPHNHIFAFPDIPNEKLRTVPTIICRHDLLDVERFRQITSTRDPLLITESTDPHADTAFSSQIPAVRKWFENSKRPVEGGGFKYRFSLKPRYLTQFKDAILPYELVTPAVGSKPAKNSKRRDQSLERFRRYIQWVESQSDEGGKSDLGRYLPTFDEVAGPPLFPIRSRDVSTPRHWTERFHTFNAPLQLLLLASTREKISDNFYQDYAPDDMDISRLPGLYIAQAQLSSLPPEMREDLPTPKLVELAGRGDIYDANLWLGTPPTYTPLHKDPNPNFFVQLTGRKLVRLFPPEVGWNIFDEVRARLGSPASPTFRDEEMMVGPEKELLERRVWHYQKAKNGYEAMVRPGDALYIPKGWWHSVKSVNTDVNASVNWWFR